MKDWELEFADPQGVFEELSRLRVEIAKCSSLQDELAECRLALDSKQAKIDALMLEYCPEDMTAEQLAAYEAAQGISKNS